jgi:hypothetical protein
MLNVITNGYSSNQTLNDAHSTFLFVASWLVVNRGYPQPSVELKLHPTTPLSQTNSKLPRANHPNLSHALQTVTVRLSMNEACLHILYEIWLLRKTTTRC